MKIVAIIPARYESSRFPGKPLAFICGKPMIQWVYENVSKVDKIDNLYVATDDKRIYDTVLNFGGKAIMTSKNHICGTNRIAECVQILGLNNDDIVLNIQGDEPLIKEQMIEQLISCFDNKDIYISTLKQEITNNNDLSNPNIVKVITDINNYAIYFSRYGIPYERDVKVKHYRHIGIYGFKKSFLLKYSSMEKTMLEESECLEQLRILENGYKIFVKETEYRIIGVDTPEELKQVEDNILNEFSR